MVDNCRSSDGEVEGLSDDYKELEFLSMVNVGLTSLAKLPSLPKLLKVSIIFCPRSYFSTGHGEVKMVHPHKTKCNTSKMY